MTTEERIAANKEAERIAFEAALNLANSSYEESKEAEDLKDYEDYKANFFGE